MDDHSADPADLLRDEYERRVAALHAELAAATGWWERFRLRRRLMQLRQRTFNRDVTQW